MFAARNHIAERLNAFEDTGHPSELHRLRTAQAYIQRFVEATPDGTDELMIAVLEVGLKLDAFPSKLDKVPLKLTRTATKAVLLTIVEEANELLGALHQFDIIAQSSIGFVDEDDLRRWGAREEVLTPLDDR